MPRWPFPGDVPIVARPVLPEPQPERVCPRSMEVTDIRTDGYERIVRARDPESGLHALISVHDTTLGPALGGLRMWNYKSEEEALFDVNRLSRGMTFKSAVAQTGLGGGKSVIIGDPKAIKSEALYLAMGRFIDGLSGLYITAEDVNTKIQDLEIVRHDLDAAGGHVGIFRTLRPAPGRPLYLNNPFGAQRVGYIVCLSRYLRIEYHLDNSGTVP